MLRTAILSCLLLIGCARQGAAAAPGTGRYAMCVIFAVAAVPSQDYADGQAAFARAMAEHDAGGDASSMFAVAGDSFHQVCQADPGHTVACANMRIAYADAALSDLNQGNENRAYMTLAWAKTHDGAQEATWQRFMDALPSPPRCAFRPGES